MLWRICRTLTLVLGLLGLTTPIWAQSQATTGVIEGTVGDDSGAPLPGVLITMRNTATNFARSATSDADGRFIVPLLPLGPYEVTAELDGFATLKRDGFRLSVGQSINLALTMTLSTVQKEIVVTADTPLIETTRTGNLTKIDIESIEGLPNNGRDFLDFSLLTPGVAIVQGPDGEELSINGQKGIQNNVMVDGADFNNPFFGEQRGGQRAAFTFNLDAIEEVVVVADGASAEFGRSSGGFVNVVTKSGTNDIKGTAHFFFKQDSLSALGKKVDGTTDPSFGFDQEQIGFTLGGPIITDKAFFFTSVDVQRSRSNKQTDPNRIEQRVVEAFAALGSSAENAPIDRTDDARVILLKTDWHLSNNHLLTVRYNHTWSEQENGTFDVDSWGTSANAIEKDSSHAITGTLTSTLSDNVYNELRFQWARENRPRPYDGPLVPGQDRPFPDTAFDFGRAYRFGMPFFIPVDYYDTRLQLNDNLSIIKGAHSLKFGAELNRVESVQTFRGFVNGRYIFSSTDGFLNYLANPSYVECSDGSSSGGGSCPEGTEISGPVLLYLQQAGVGDVTAEEAGTQGIPQWEPALFIQDKWQPNRNLTIEAGLRWEAQIQPDPITPASDVFYTDFIGQTVMTDAGAQTFPSDGEIPSDYKMIQPRLAITWDPTGDGKTAIRANSGLFYARIPGLALASTRSTNGSLGQTLFRSSNAAPFLGPVPIYPNLIPQSEIGAPAFPDVFVFDEDFRNPRTWSSSLSVEREVIPDLSGLVKFNYSSTDFLTRFTNRNDPLLGSPWGSGLGPDGSNGLNTLTTVESTAKSRYWGLTLGVTKKSSNNFQFQVNYTLSEDKSDDDNERDPFSFRYAKITDLDAEYGFSDRDQRHRLNGWLLTRLPGDVELNARYSYRSAQPKSITASGEDAFTPQDRINADGSVTQRNLGRKDNEFSSLDLRFARKFQLGTTTLEPILEIFNLFNAANVLQPQTTSLVFNFDGTVQSGAGQPRQVQLGLRASF